MDAGALRTVVNSRRKCCQHDAAVFWADKLFSITGADEDLLLLAQCHLDIRAPSRALQLLRDYELPSRNLEAKVAAGHCLLALKNWIQLLELVEGSTADLKKSLDRAMSTLKSVPAPFSIPEPQILAELCVLRGIAQQRLEIPDKAVSSFREALTLDPFCYQALEKLTENNLMRPQQELELLESLNSPANSGVDTPFLKAVYSTHTSKTQSKQFVESQIDLLTKHYKLGSNADVLSSRAEILYLVGNYRASLDLTERVLRVDSFHTKCLLTQIACFYQLKRKNDLFLLAHNLVDASSGHLALPWYAVGVYYLLTRHMDKARTYFRKSLSYETTMIHAWIGFGHTFALEEEHDPALAAYTTATRLSMGSHLPLLFIGLEHLKMNDLVMAEQFLTQAYNFAPEDFLTLNELGVLYYRNSQYNQAKTFLERAIAVDPHNPNLENTFINLGHTLRKLGNLDLAKDQFERALQLKPASASTLTAIGFVLQLQGDFIAAVEFYHQALGVKPDYSMASDLLSRAMEDILLVPVASFLPFSVMPRPPVIAGGASASAKPRGNESAAASVNTSTQSIEMSFDDS